jgi:hypothetical protein
MKGNIVKYGEDTVMRGGISVEMSGYRDRIYKQPIEQVKKGTKNGRSA